jgi:ATP-dependent Zn protease
MNLDFNNIAIFALIGSLIACWNHVRSIIVNIFSLVVRNDVISSDRTSIEFIHKILDDIKIIHWGNKKYNDNWLYNYKFQTGLYAITPLYNSYFVIYKKCVPLILTKEGHGIKITYLFKTFNVDKIMEMVHQTRLTEQLEEREKERKAAENNKIGFYLYERHGSDIMSSPISTGEKASTSSDSKAESSAPALTSNEYNIFDKIRTFKHKSSIIGMNYDEFLESKKDKDIPKMEYYWSDEAKQLDSEIDFWLNSRKWFHDRKICWKRGVLLYGPPGTGKTKMVVECAKKNQIPVKRLNISNMSDTEFVSYFTTDGYREIIILIEDIDAVFEKRDNILNKSQKMKQLLSFDVLINTISGMKENSGILTIITTNKPELLDEALIRPGRIDKRIETGVLCEEGRRFIAHNILRDWPETMEEIIKKCSNCVAAEFENLCIEVAVKKFHEDNYK